MQRAVRRSSAMRSLRADASWLGSGERGLDC